MPRWLKTVLILAAVLWAGVVYRPYLFGADAESRGFVGDDLIVLVDAAGSDPDQVTALQDMTAQEYLAAAGPEGSYLGGASLALSRRLWQATESSATLYRLENLLLLLALGLGLGQFVRRLLIPWTGLDHARAAARGVPVVLGLHPFTVHAVARIESRPDILALALGAWAAASYLRARQERKPGGVLLAAAIAALAHLAGGFGVGLAVLLAVAEGLSVQRYQAGRRRLLRALTTLVLFTLVAGLELVARRAGGVAPEALELMPRELGGLFERLGILLIPLPAPGVLQVLAVLLFLVAMHPALRAARAAPRLWGWLLFVWGAVLTATLALHVGAVRVGLGDFTSAADLFPAAVIWCAGLVIVATGVQGFRRLFLPIGLALGLGILSLAQAGAHTGAVRATHQVRAELERGADAALAFEAALAREGRGTAAGPSVIVLRGTVEPELIDPFTKGVADHLAPTLTGERRAVRPPLLATPAAFLAFAREPEFDERRRGGLVVVSGGEVIEVPPPAPLETPPLWRGDPLSPDLNLDPRNFGAVLAVVELPDDPLPTELAFRVRGQAERRGAVGGVWVRTRGRIEGRFDVSASLDWLLAERIARVSFESGLARVESGQFQAELTPTAELAFTVEDDAWRVPIPADGAELSRVRDPAPSSTNGSENDSTSDSGNDAGNGRTNGPATDRYVLVQLDLTDLTLRELVADTSTPGTLRFAGAQPEGGPTAWALERRIDGHVVWRARGRVQ